MKDTPSEQRTISIGLRASESLPSYPVESWTGHSRTQIERDFLAVLYHDRLRGSDEALSKVFLRNGEPAGAQIGARRKREKDHRSDRWSSKPCGFRFAFTLPVSCGQTGGCRRVDPRFALAVWTLTFGPLAVETSVPSDACHPWLWSLSVLVTLAQDGARNQSINRRSQRSIKAPVPF
jgi:hypothetical protein